MNDILVYIMLGIVLVLINWIYMWGANKYQILDVPNSRSSHNKPIIRGGGILFFAAICIGFSISNFNFFYAFIGIAILASISFIDDLKNLSPKTRLPFHFVGVALICYQLGLLEVSILLFVVALFLGTIFINIYNFMDGINAITGFYSIVIISSFLVLDTIEKTSNFNYFIFVLCSLFIFGFYNYRNQARVFAGDVGSITLAIFIFFYLTYFIQTLEAPILILFVAIYMVDGIMTIFFRLVRRENITKAHRNHLYQKLVDKLAWSHLKVSIIYTLLQAVLCVIAILSYKLEIITQAIIIIFVVIFLMILYIRSVSAIESSNLS